MKKRKRTSTTTSDEARKRHEESQKRLADRIAYHRAKIEEERAEREREAS